MALKIYGIHGRSTALIRIPAGNGKAWIECEFTKGRPTKGANYKPATYATSDKTAQAIIERSSYFGTIIKLIEVYGTDSAPKKNEAEEEFVMPVAINEKKAQVFEDVTTYEQAIAKLKALGVKATQLRSTAAIQKAMVVLNISFPNYSFE